MMLTDYCACHLCVCPGVWEGITSTRYEPAGPEGEEKCVGQRRVQCKPEATLPEIVASCGQLPDVELPCLPAGTWQYGINATALPQTLAQDQQVIWFQCPWVLKNDVFAPYNTAKLVSKFLLNTASQIQPGIHVCVGITKHPRYVCG